MVSGLFTRVMQTRGVVEPRCLVCHERVRDGEPRVRFHGDIHVHRECATYSLRRVPTGTERLGYPPRRVSD